MPFEDIIGHETSIYIAIGILFLISAGLWYSGLKQRNKPLRLASGGLALIALAAAIYVMIVIRTHAGYQIKFVSRALVVLGGVLAFMSTVKRVSKRAGWIGVLVTLAGAIIYYIE